MNMQHTQAGFASLLTFPVYL